MKALLGLVVIGAIIWGLVSWALYGIHWNTGNGEHAGYITAVETNGLIFKTDRAYVKSETESSQEDAYCVVNPEVKKLLQDAALAKSRVKVHYISWFDSGILYCKGEEAVIDSVEVLIK